MLIRFMGYSMVIKGFIRIIGSVFLWGILNLYTKKGERFWGLREEGLKLI